VTVRHEFGPDGVTTGGSSRASSRSTSRANSHTDLAALADALTLSSTNPARGSPGSAPRQDQNNNQNFEPSSFPWARPVSVHSVPTPGEGPDGNQNTSSEGTTEDDEEDEQPPEEINAILEIAIPTWATPSHAIEPVQASQSVHFHLCLLF
jgi:hypothetical protein